MPIAARSSAHCARSRSSSHPETCRRSQRSARMPTSRGPCRICHRPGAGAASPGLRAAKARPQPRPGSPQGPSGRTRIGPDADEKWRRQRPSRSAWTRRRSASPCAAGTGGRQRRDTSDVRASRPAIRVRARGGPQRPAPAAVSGKPDRQGNPAHGTRRSRCDDPSLPGQAPRRAGPAKADPDDRQSPSVLDFAAPLTEA